MTTVLSVLLQCQVKEGVDKSKSISIKCKDVGENENKVGVPILENNKPDELPLDSFEDIHALDRRH